jgi:uncharacterized protein
MIITEKAIKVSTQLKHTLKELYGNKLSSLILFGSYARGDFNDDSDMDFAVVINDNTISPASEILKISPLSSIIGLEYDVLVSILPVSLYKLSHSQLSVYQSIRSEGLLL